MYTPDEIFENSVDKVFLVYPNIAIAEQIILQRPELNYGLRGSVGNPDCSKIRQTRKRAYCGEFVGIDRYNNLFAGIFIRKGFKYGNIDRRLCGQVIPSIQWLRHL
jgi:hypothetical protein